MKLVKVIKFGWLPSLMALIDLNSVHRLRTLADEVGFFDRWTSLTATLLSALADDLGWHFQTDPCGVDHTGVGDTASAT